MIHLVTSLLFLTLCIGCLTTRTPVKSTKTKINHTQPNSIHFSWPSSSSVKYKLTENQIDQLRKIIKGSLLTDRYHPVFSRFSSFNPGSPAPSLSSFIIDGETYHFLPPATTVHFKLSSHEQKIALGHFMEREFGIKKAGDKPQPTKKNTLIESY